MITGPRCPNCGDQPIVLTGDDMEVIINLQLAEINRLRARVEAAEQGVAEFKAVIDSLPICTEFRHEHENI